MYPICRSLPYLARRRYGRKAHPKSNKSNTKHTLPRYVRSPVAVSETAQGVLPLLAPADNAFLAENKRWYLYKVPALHVPPGGREKK
jgi:hypothetical protein